VASLELTQQQQQPSVEKWWWWSWRSRIR